MNKKLLATVVAIGIVISSCSDSKISKKAKPDSGDLISGVAAVGAPIANGLVEVKGANGVVVSTTTNANGVYGVGLGSLGSPYLVRVTSPTGQKYFTVASREDVLASKKINITPITHTIVANVFKEKSPDILFDDFIKKSSEYSKVAVDSARDDFKQKMIEAGVIGSEGIITDTNIDLMNGSFTAGSSIGVDKLLDALEIDVEKGDKNIEVNLKGGIKIYKNNIADSSLSVLVLLAQGTISAANENILILKDIRDSLNNINRIFKSINNCNGPAVNGGDCDKNSLYNLAKGIFHNEYKSGGQGKVEAVWASLCTSDTEGYNDAKDASSCKFINSTAPAFADVIVIDTNRGNDELAVQFSVYLNNEFSHAWIEVMSPDIDDGDINNNKNFSEKVWKLKGDQNSYDYSFDPLSVHRTVISSSALVKKVHSYESQIDLYIHGSALGLLTLKAINNDKLGSSNISLNSAFSGTANNSIGLELTSDLNKLYVTANKFYDYNKDEFSATECGTCYESFDSSKINLSETAFEYMDAVQKFEIKIANDTSKKEIIYLRRPMKITAQNAAMYVPDFSSSDLCGTVKTSYPIVKPANQTYGFGWINLYMKDDATFNPMSLNGSGLTQELSSLNIENIGANFGKAIDHASFSLSSEDKVGRSFSRIIECK